MAVYKESACPELLMIIQNNQLCDLFSSGETTETATGQDATQTYRDKVRRFILFFLYNKRRLGSNVSKLGSNV